jgi:hypothetical protein
VHGADVMSTEHTKSVAPDEWNSNTAWLWFVIAGGV